MEYHPGVPSRRSSDSVLEGAKRDPQQGKAHHWSSHSKERERRNSSLSTVSLPLSMSDLDFSPDIKRNRDFSMENYTIDFGKLGIDSDGGREEFGRYDVSDRNIMPFSEEVLEVASEDEGPQDFTIDLGKYMIGAKSQYQESTVAQSDHVPRRPELEAHTKKCSPPSNGSSHPHNPERDTRTTDEPDGQNSRSSHEQTHENHDQLPDLNFGVEKQTLEVHNDHGVQQVGHDDTLKSLRAENDQLKDEIRFLHESKASIQREKEYQDVQILRTLESLSRETQSQQRILLDRLKAMEEESQMRETDAGEKISGLQQQLKFYRATTQHSKAVRVGAMEREHPVETEARFEDVQPAPIIVEALQNCEACVKLESTQQELAAARTEVRELEARLANTNEIEKDAKCLGALNEKLERQLESVAITARETTLILKNEHLATQLQLAEEKLVAEELRKELSAARREIASVKETKVAKVEAKFEHESDLKREVKEMKAKIKGLVSNLERAEHQNELAENSLRERKACLDRLEQSIANIQAETESTKNALDQSRKELQESRDEIQDAHAEHEATKLALEAELLNSLDQSERSWAEKEANWQKREEALQRDRKFMREVLLQQWGKEEVGEVEKQGAIGRPVRGMGYHYKYVKA